MHNGVIASEKRILGKLKMFKYRLCGIFRSVFENFVLASNIMFNAFNACTFKHPLSYGTETNVSSTLLNSIYRNNAVAHMHVKVSP